MATKDAIQKPVEKGDSHGSQRSEGRNTVPKELMNSLLDEIRNAREIHDFPYTVGDQTFEITVKRFLPGTASRKRNTSLIKLHKVIQVEAKPLSEMSHEEFQKGIDTQQDRLSQLNQDFCECVVNKETGETYLSIEEAEELFTEDFKTDCVNWAMGGATPSDDENLTEEEEFPAVSDGPEE